MVITIPPIVMCHSSLNVKWHLFSHISALRYQLLVAVPLCRVG